ncbi:MAG: class B sortase [Erysipelotrichales bacterium]|nr:class B sortase [Erysipelotrichales bacterium]
MKLRKRINISKTNLLLLIPSVICITIGSLNVIKWAIDNNNTNKVIDNLSNIVDVDKSAGEAELIEQETKISKDDPYWDYIKMDLINVDFQDLKKQNKETVGWIQVNGTNINYPFVQTTDNDFYLNHSFDRKYNGAGWVFMDYRNDISNLDKNTILYAHSRLNKTMFGSLKNIFTSGWLNNKDNYVIKLSTEYENTLWQVFSVYRIPSTNDYIRVVFNDDNQFIEWTNMILKRSSHNFKTTVSKNDHILTLSTCGDNDTKVVLHAKLIKKETR